MPESLDDEKLNVASVEEQDRRFRYAMNRAIIRGLENPPIGVDRRPGTWCPIVLPRPLVPVGGSNINFD